MKVGNWLRVIEAGNVLGFEPVHGLMESTHGTSVRATDRANDRMLGFNARSDGLAFHAYPPGCPAPSTGTGWKTSLAALNSKR